MILAKRLSIVIGDLVGNYQSGFIASRHIWKGVEIIQKVVHHCKKTRQQGYLLKLDFAKVYDTVD